MSAPAALRCNRCWEPLKDTAFVTACCHIFCAKDATNWFSSKRECPACQRPLSRWEYARAALIPARRGSDADRSSNEHDLRQVTLEQSAEMLGMALWGQSPSTVMECCTSAITFWEYQKSQEVAWHRHSLQTKEKQILSVEHHFRDKLVEAQNALNSLTHKVASLEDELARRVRQLQAMEAECQEKARQCRKYEQLYHALRSRRSPPGGAAGAMSGVVVLGANGGGGPSSSSASQLGGPSASAPPSPMVMAPGPSRGAASRGGGGGSVPPALTMEGGMPARAASHDPAFAASASRFSMLSASPRMSQTPSTRDSSPMASSPRSLMPLPQPPQALPQPYPHGSQALAPQNPTRRPAQLPLLSQLIAASPRTTDGAASIRAILSGRARANK